MCTTVSVCFVGIDSLVAGASEHFAKARITGQQLLMMILTNDDLEQIGISELGHQEILLQSIALLQTLVSLTQPALCCKQGRLRFVSFCCKLFSVNRC